MSNYTLVPVRAVRNDLVTQTDYIIYVPLATTTTPGIVQIGTGLNISNAGLLSINEIYLNEKIDNKITSHNALDDNTVHPYLQNLISTVSNDLDTLENTVSNHILNINNPHSVTKSQVGLSDVDNTSDLDKPISTAVQTELNKKLYSTVTEPVSSGAADVTEITNIRDIYLISKSYNPSSQVGKSIFISPTNVKIGYLVNTSWTYKNVATEDYVTDQGFITKAVNNLENYYLKTQTYTQTEINNLIGQIQTIHFEIVNTLPVTGESNIIYLVPAPDSEEDNVYEEYVWINNDWELIGTTAVDLSNYLAKDNVVIYTPTTDYNPATKKYVDDSIATREKVLNEESHTIQTTDWQDLSSSKPYEFSATITATYTIGNDTEVGTINDQPVLFGNYGFVVGALNGQSVTIYAVKKPETSVTLLIGFRG